MMVCNVTCLFRHFAAIPGCGFSCLFFRNFSSYPPIPALSSQLRGGPGSTRK